MLKEAITSVVYSIKCSLLVVVVLDSVFLLGTIVWALYRLIFDSIGWSGLVDLMYKFGVFILTFSSIAGLGIFTLIILYLAAARFIKT